jgi:hypothetical protein
LPDPALRGGAVNARSRATTVAAVGAAHRGIDGAEHSARMSAVMAGAFVILIADKSATCTRDNSMRI